MTKGEELILKLLPSFLVLHPSAKVERDGEGRAVGASWRHDPTWAEPFLTGFRLHRNIPLTSEIVEIYEGPASFMKSWSIYPSLNKVVGEGPLPAWAREVAHAPRR